ncbi:MAG: 2-polyprenylphenol 6-hydroxylase [Alphaproteobacteria bacterium]
MIRATRNVVRLFHIARRLAEFDALFLLEKFGIAPAITATARLIVKNSPDRSIARLRPGQRLALAIQGLGPSFIKFGQLLSTRSDLLGEEVASDLSELQDKLPPFPGASARRIIAQELGKPVEAIFSHFEETPVAAASIAQVHMAVTAEGEDVAVKILRPGIEEAFAQDLDLFYWLAEIAEWTGGGIMRRLKPVEVVRTMADTVALEMDLRFEAAAASELSENFAGDPTFRVPRIDWSRTSKRVLTLERVSGIPIDEREAIIAAGHDPRTIIAQAAAALFQQAFRDGFFHADLHPGNLFVDRSGHIVAIDFGIMGRLDLKTRNYLAEMLIGFLSADYRAAAEAHFKAGYVPANKSVAAFTQACRSIAEPILGRPLAEISLARLLGQLFQVAETFEMETQPQLLLLQKTMLVAEGVGRSLDPTVNMWELARPLIEAWMVENRGPQAKLRHFASDFVTALERLPTALAGAERMLTMLSEGGLRLHPESIRALTGAGARHNRSWLWALWIAVALIALIAFTLF